MSTGDSKITIQNLKETIKKFRQAHAKHQLNKPKNLAMFITAQAAELMKLFLWKSQQNIALLHQTDPMFKEKIKDELAGIFFASLNFAEKLDIDLSSALLAKIKNWESTKTCPVCAIACKNCADLHDIYNLTRESSDTCKCITCQCIREAQEECKTPCSACGGKPWEKTKKPAKKKTPRKKN